MNHYLILPIIQTVFSLALAVLVLKGHSRSFVHRLFSIDLLVLAAWGFVIFGMRASPDIEHAYSWDRWAIPLAPLMSVLLYHFSVRYTSTKIKSWVIPSLYATWLVFIPLAATELVFSGMQIKSYGYAPTLGPVAPFFLLYCYAISVMALVTFIRGYRRAFSAEHRNRIAYIITGVSITFVGGAFDVLPILGLPLYPGAIIGNLVFCSLTTVAIIRHKLLDLSIVLRKSIVYVLTSALIAIPFVGVFLIIAPLVEEISVFPLWARLLLLIALAFILPLLWRWVQKRVDRWFYRERYDYLKALEIFSQDTQSVTDSAQPGSTMVNLIAKALGISRVYLLQPLPQSGDFAVACSSGTDSSTTDIVLKGRSPLLRWLGRNGDMLAYQDLNFIPQLQPVVYQEKKDLEQIGTEFIVPMRTRIGNLSGLLILGPKLSEQPYTIEDKELINTICNQMSTNLENARLYAASQQEVAERKQAEEALRESEERFRSIVENSQAGIMILDDAYRFLYVNDELCKISGYSRKEVIGQDFRQFLDEESKRLVADRYIRRQKGEEVPPRYEFNIVCKDGQKKRVEISSTVLKDSAGAVKTIAQILDITERKQAEETLQTERNKLESVIGTMVDHLTIRDKDYNLIYQSESSQRIFGNHLGEKCYRVYEGQDKVCDGCPVKKAFRDGKSHTSERKVILPSGEVSFWENTTNPIRDAKGKITSCLEVARNITERKQAEEALKRAEQEKTIILHSLSELMIFQDLNHRMIWTNKAAAESVGMSPQQMVGRYCYELWGESSEPCQGCPLEKVSQTGQPQAGEMTTPDGRMWNVRGYPVRDANGEITSLVEVADDITERKRAEEKLKQSRQRLRDLSAHIESMREAERTTIAREVHDELGQALTALKMDLAWLNKRLPEEQETLVKKTKEMSNLISTTIQTVKRISTQLRPGVLDDLGLMAAIEWQVQEFQERTRIKCEFSADGEDMNLDRDLATAVFRILQEALINITRHADATRVEVSLREKDKHLVLQVRDNGKGITEKQITHPKSFGLIGMRERVRSWNGSVKIDGISGKGTLVTVSIPLDHEEEERDDKNTGRR